MTFEQTSYALNEKDNDRRLITEVQSKIGIDLTYRFFGCYLVVLINSLELIMTMLSYYLIFFYVRSVIYWEFTNSRPDLS